MKPLFTLAFGSVIAIGLLFTILLPAVTSGQSSQLQQIHHILSTIRSIDEVSQQDYNNIVYNLSNVPFHEFLLGLNTEASPVVRQVTMQTLSNIIQYNSPFPNTPQKEHPYSQQLEQLSSFFISWYKKNPIEYYNPNFDSQNHHHHHHHHHDHDHDHHEKNNDKTFNFKETELITIIQPISNIATLDPNQSLRQIAIELSKLIIRSYPGTMPTMIKLLHYLSGEDTIIAGVLYRGSIYAGNSRYISQQFHAKIVRLHLSSVYTNDFEILHAASESLLALYKASEEHSQGDGVPGAELQQDIDDFLKAETEALNQNGTNPRMNTLQRQNRARFLTMQVHDGDKSGKLKSGDSTFVLLNFTDPSIDGVINEINKIALQSDDLNTIYECVRALSDSKISNSHLNTFHSLVIAPENHDIGYGIASYALVGIKRIALLSAVPGTIYINTDGSTLTNPQSASGSQQFAKTKYVQAVSQAELTTLIHPSHGQLAIKLLKHSSLKHYHPNLRQYSSVSFDEVIAEVKAQLQDWYSQTASKGLIVYSEQDLAQSNMNDLKFKLHYHKLNSAYSRGELARRYAEWSKQQQPSSRWTDENGQERDVSSVQQMLNQAKKRGGVVKDDKKGGKDGKKKKNNHIDIIATTKNYDGDGNRVGGKVDENRTEKNRENGANLNPNINLRPENDNNIPINTISPSIPATSHSSEIPHTRPSPAHPTNQGSRITNAQRVQ
jgi:hypothetical protein